MSFLGRASCGFEGSMVTSKGIEGLNSAEYKVCLTSQTTTLQGQGLNTEAAQELIQASKAVGWSNLCPMLNKLADVTCRVKKSVALLTAAFQALTLLLGVEDVGVQSAVWPCLQCSWLRLCGNVYQMELCFIKPT